ncbi:HTH-type transcriptional regulator SutR [Pontiella desulfatans]|uniref:HTH-type transcriptional regulator SutR n=1 Tax=Pontiella desulfatans TaxID=2750659 RepID=A0A6C2U424_PONDE|nr:XRE family transcriptional regulator [Pontiella desulfatans]VGO14569.1 HTH-type transcriptional regulator SutR [Pontiella desulfatans]
MAEKSDNSMDMYNFSVLRDLRKRDGMTIADLSERTGISPAVISKLERNQTVAELKTLFRLARAFGLTASEMLGLVESRTAQCKQETDRRVGDFHFRQIEFANCRCFYADAPKGAQRSNPDAHRDDFEVCWVLEGTLRLDLPYESHVLSAGDCLQFDAVFEHTYEVLEDCRIIIQHIRKPKRF